MRLLVLPKGRERLILSSTSWDLLQLFLSQVCNTVALLVMQCEDSRRTHTPLANQKHQWPEKNCSYDSAFYPPYSSTSAWKLERSHFQRPLKELLL